MPDLCKNCGQEVVQTDYGTWVHAYLDVTFCASQFPETVYNNWDHRVAQPEKTGDENDQS